MSAPHSRGGADARALFTPDLVQTARGPVELIDAGHGPAVLALHGGMGGCEAIKLLRKIDPDVKAIVSSGYSSSPVMADYQAAGFVGMVMKPYTMDELSKALAPFHKG